VVVFFILYYERTKIPGFSVVRSEQGEIFYATTGSKGELVATNLQVGKDNPVAHGLSQGVVPPAAVDKDCDTQLCKEEETEEAASQLQMRSINNATPKSKKTNHKKAGQARYTSTAPPETTTTTTTKTAKKKSNKRRLRSISTTTTTTTTDPPSLEPTKEPTEEGIDEDERHTFVYDDDLVESDQSHSLPRSSSSKNNIDDNNSNNSTSWRTLQAVNAQTIGTVRNLVVPIRFKDHVGRTLPTRGRLLKLFNYDTAASGGKPSTICPTGSVRDVFLQNSYGKLNLISTVLNWVDVPYTEQQIAAGTSGYVCVCSQSISVLSSLSLAVYACYVMYGRMCFGSVCVCVFVALCVPLPRLFLSVFIKSSLLVPSKNSPTSPRSATIQQQLRHALTKTKNTHTHTQLVHQHSLDSRSSLERH
jgi:hypothetical protein